MQGSRDDLSTAGGFQGQTAMKHANSVDTSFSKDVLNSIAGMNDRMNTHTGRCLSLSVHRAFCLAITGDAMNPFYTMLRDTWCAMYFSSFRVFSG